MKTIFSTIILAVCFSFTALPQALISVELNGISSLYNNLDSAIINAQPGSVILLPGGIFICNTDINKPIHIKGVGHYPDSTTATGRTVIPNNITITSEGSYGSIEGVSFTGNIYYSSVIHHIIRRCKINILSMGWYQSSDIVISENSIYQLQGGVNSSLIEKNIIIGLYMAGSLNFVNNIFLAENAIFWTSNCQFNNNVFYGAGAIYAQSGNNVFYNNLFVDNETIISGSNTGYNNIFNQPQSSIFVSHSGSLFSYESNFHLQPGSPGIGAGNDGHDIGIYGTAIPYKEGGVPSNPHIQMQNISLQDNLLQIDVRVSAQEY